MKPLSFALVLYGLHEASLSTNLGSKNEASITKAIFLIMRKFRSTYVSYFSMADHITNIQKVKKVLPPTTILCQLQTPGFISALGVSTPEILFGCTMHTRFS